MQHPCIRGPLEQAAGGRVCPKVPVGRVAPGTNSKTDLLTSMHRNKLGIGTECELSGVFTSAQRSYMAYPDTIVVARPSGRPYFITPGLECRWSYLTGPYHLHDTHSFGSSNLPLNHQLGGIMDFITVIIIWLAGGDHGFHDVQE